VNPRRLVYEPLSTSTQCPCGQRHESASQWKAVRDFVGAALSTITLEEAIDAVSEGRRIRSGLGNVTITVQRMPLTIHAVACACTQDPAE
jgi:hypothetical protein